ncbi:unnamed protein product [Dibothriocephalus latus]|uniref:Uncharacterized protein n=1 Tax=Dibothriocephalus latus TaxID=60516 RepID=A0A3P6SVF9_DIBLA|nr:unnamed protein product [Dibothriocephalus latus]
MKPLKAFKKEENIFIVPGDKGSSAVILHKSTYHATMLSLLEDKSTYTPLKTDPTKTQDAAIDKVLKRRTSKKDIAGAKPKETQLISTDGLINTNPTYHYVKWNH